MTAGLSGEGTGGAGGPIRTWRRLCWCSYPVEMVWNRGIGIGDTDDNGSGGLSSEKDGGGIARRCRESVECKNADVVARGVSLEDADGA